jgi:hypothetical protein
MKLNIKNFMNETVFLVPILCLIVSFISVFTNYSIIRNSYLILANLGGYSLLINYSLIYHFTLRRKYCYLTRLSPIGLIILNIVDIIGYSTTENFYNFWYTVITCAIVIGLVGILEIKKIINK